MTPPPSPDLATRLHAVTAQIRDMAGPCAEFTKTYPWPTAQEFHHGHQVGTIDATFIASMSPDIAILIADVMDAVAEEHIAIHWPHDDDHEYVCARCGLDSPCADLTRWAPLVEAFEARR